MPRLNKAKDGHYFIRGIPPSTHRMCTWQVNAVGVQYLRERGKDDRDVINWQLFSILQNHGYLSTGGGGYSTTPLEFTFDSIKAPNYTSLQLAIRLTIDDWSLNVIYPEVEPEWANNPELLAKCSFQIDNNFLSAINLWPGKGGSVLPVSPHDSNYISHPNGELLNSGWDLSRFIGEVNGLHTKGTFFHGDDDGLRLSHDEVIIPGNSYLLIVSKHEYDFKLPPQILHPTQFKSKDGWQLWRIEIPEIVNEEIESWIAKLGQAICQPATRLKLLSPPPYRYTIHHLAVIPNKQIAIIGISFPENAAWKTKPFNLALYCLDDGEISEPVMEFTNLPTNKDNLYLSLQLYKPGNYRLQAIKGLAIPLSFQVSDDLHNQADLTIPKPLSMSIKSGHHDLTVSGFEKTSGAKNILVDDSDFEHQPLMKINCPIPLQIAWQYNEEKKRYRNILWDSILDEVSTDFINAWINRKAFKLELDAGAFGRICINLVYELNKREGDQYLPANILSEAQRLAVLKSAIMSRGNLRLVYIPSFVKTKLQLFDNTLPDLARLKTIPFELLAPLISLAHTIDNLPQSESNNRNELE